MENNIYNNKKKQIVSKLIKKLKVDTISKCDFFTVPVARFKKDSIHIFFNHYEYEQVISLFLDLKFNQDNGLDLKLNLIVNRNYTSDRFYVYDDSDDKNYFYVIFQDLYNVLEHLEIVEEGYFDRNNFDLKSFDVFYNLAHVEYDYIDYEIEKGYGIEFEKITDLISEYLFGNTFGDYHVYGELDQVKDSFTNIDQMLFDFSDGSLTDPLENTEEEIIILYNL